MYGEDAYSNRLYGNRPLQRQRLRTHEVRDYPRFQNGSDMVPHESRDSTFKAIGRVEAAIERVERQLNLLSRVSRTDEKWQHPSTYGVGPDEKPKSKVLQSDTTENEA